MSDSTPMFPPTLDLASSLGAQPGSSTQCFTVYIPNKDRGGKEIGTQRKWVLEAIKLLTEINGGATALPTVEGAWMDEKGEVIWEHPVIVYSYIRLAKFVENLLRVR